MQQLVAVGSSRSSCVLGSWALSLVPVAFAACLVVGALPAIGLVVASSSLVLFCRLCLPTVPPGAVVHVSALSAVLAMRALPCQPSTACLFVSAVHVLYGPRIQSLYALYMLHVVSTRVLQVVCWLV